MDFKKDVIERSKTTPVIVDFFADWCGPCRMIKPFLLDSVKKHNISLVMVDVDSNIELAKEYNVRHIPYIVLFKNGRIESKYPGGQIDRWVQQALE